MADNDHVNVHLLFTANMLETGLEMNVAQPDVLETGRWTYPMIAVVCDFCGDLNGVNGEAPEARGGIRTVCRARLSAVSGEGEKW